jgi:hypothetical protein
MIAGIVAAVAVICVLVSALFLSSLVPAVGTPHELDFTVTGTNECLRFLNSTVSTVYVPFTTGANQNWQLTINCTKMPGGANGWTDVYVYQGYWDKGVNHTCTSQDIYPILSQIQNVAPPITANTTFTQTYGGPTQQSYTVFFIFPPGGQAAFHITLKPV